MLKQAFMLLGVLSVQVYASSGVEDSNINKREAAEGVKLDDYPYGVAEEIKNAKDGPVEGQRQKRFYEYIGYNAAGASSFNPFPSAPTYAWGDNSPGTDMSDEQYKLNEILKRVKNLADITKRQYLPPVNHPKVHYPSFIPYFIPQFRCTCPQVIKPVNRPQPAPQTTVSPPNTGSTPSTTANTEKPETTNISQSFDNRDFNVSSPGLIPNDEFPDDYEDGVRPISFDPITPKVPIGVEPPPVEHGSFQAGLNPNPTELNPPGSAASQSFPTQNFPTVAVTIPTICDGAILACCHKKEVTNACFVREGCGDIEHDDPCDPIVLSKVVSKFRAYINQRRG